MAHALRRQSDNIKQIRSSVVSTAVTDELARIMNLLRTVCPADATIGFEFAGRLVVSIDVRKREEVLLIQAVLPTIENGLFAGITLGNTPNRAFFHRISAEVAR